jgi:hypothetical protein
MMDGLNINTDEGRLGLIYGRAGHGKSRTAEWFAVNNNSLYLRIVSIWSELDFLRALCVELGEPQPPKRKGACFAIITDALIHHPRTIFLDEVEKLTNPRRFLEIIRDFSDITTAPVVMIGEEELYHLMRQSDRITSRTYRQLKFEPIDAADIIIYTRAAVGIALDLPAARQIHAATHGDFRDIKRVLFVLMDAMNAAGKTTPDTALVALAINQTVKK